MIVKIQPLVSIITGYYNRTENLVESINSILNQTYQNFEFIVFDDCSNDGTRELLRQFLGHPKLKLVEHEVNIGFTRGLIKAIASAQGEYIALHGAGDISFPDRISKQVDYLTRNRDVGIVGCLIEDVYQGHVEVVSPKPTTEGGTFRYSHGEVMYRRELYYRAGGYNSLFHTGQFTMLKYELLKLSKGGEVSEVLYRRIHFNNGITKNKTKRLAQLLNIQLGINISQSGLWNIDVSSMVVALGFQNISIIRRKSSDEELLRFHLKRSSIILTMIYALYVKGLVPALYLRKIGSLMRKRKSFIR